MVSAFELGVGSRLFCDSLIRNPVDTFSEIRWREVSHINVEEAVAARNNGPQPRVAKPKETNKASRPLRVHETSTGKKTDTRHAPYKKGKAKSRRKEDEFRPKFRISYKDQHTSRIRKVEVPLENRQESEGSKGCVVRVP